MRNHVYYLKDTINAESLAEDLRQQLGMNRFDEDVNITPIPQRNQIIVQVPEAAADIEDVVDIFMADYKSGEALE